MKYESITLTITYELRILDFEKFCPKDYKYVSFLNLQSFRILWNVILSYGEASIGLIIQARTQSE